MSTSNYEFKTPNDIDVKEKDGARVTQAIPISLKWAKKELDEEKNINKSSQKKVCNKILNENVDKAGSDVHLNQILQHYEQIIQKTFGLVEKIDSLVSDKEKKEEILAVMINFVREMCPYTDDQQEIEIKKVTSNDFDEMRKSYLEMVEKLNDLKMAPSIRQKILTVILDFLKMLSALVAIGILFYAVSVGLSAAQMASYGMAKGFAERLLNTRITVVDVIAGAIFGGAGYLFFNQPKESKNKEQAKQYLINQCENLYVDVLESHYQSSKMEEETTLRVR